MQIWNEIRHSTAMTTGMRRSLNSNLTTFELRTFSSDSKFDECLNSLLSNANLC